VKGIVLLKYVLLLVQVVGQWSAVGVEYLANVQLNFTAFSVVFLLFSIISG
jgi:hypothetical protein